jgi:glycosyltransferase involved in cell wall biosynthesis
MATGFRLSVAIPIHNEESVLPELLRRLRGVLDGIAGGPHEIIFVDDGSTDKSFDRRMARLNRAMGFPAKCEVIPQKLLGTSRMAVLQRETRGHRNGFR